MKKNYIIYMYLHAIKALDFGFCCNFCFFFVFLNIIVEPACGERAIVVTIFVRCACVRLDLDGL